MRHTITADALAATLSALPNGYPAERRIRRMNGYGALQGVLNALVARNLDLHTRLHLDEHEAIGYLDAIHDLESGASLDDLRRNADERMAKCVRRH